MTAPLPFTVHAALPCQPHAGFAASLAAELGDFDDEALERGLAALELPVAGLAALGAPVRAGALRVREDGGLDDLLIDRVVTRGVGHEAMVAVVLCELGRRAGCRSASSARARATSSATSTSRHGCSTPPRARWSMRDGSAHEPEWRCGHQVADTLLDAVEQRCERAGDLSRAIPLPSCAARSRSTNSRATAGRRCGGCGRD